MKSNIKALIFDLDGTLADTIPAITEAVNMVLNELKLPIRSEKEIQSFIGRGPRHLISRSLNHDNHTPDEKLVDKALAMYDLAYKETYMHTQSLYDGIEDALLSLSKQYKIAVLSNKQDEYVKALVNQLLPTGICQIAMGSIKGVPAKPEPTLALKLAEELYVTPNECILIGDSDIDIFTAKNAGFKILSVSWGYQSKEHLVQSGTSHIIDSPNELAEYFR